MIITESINNLDITINSDEYSIRFGGRCYDGYGDGKDVDEKIYFSEQDDFESFLKFFTVFREIMKIRS